MNAKHYITDDISVDTRFAVVLADNDNCTLYAAPEIGSDKPSMIIATIKDGASTLVGRLNDECNDWLTINDEIISNNPVWLNCLRECGYLGDDDKIDAAEWVRDLFLEARDKD